jgi:AcrR family transcriptional regulator
MNETSKDHWVDEAHPDAGVREQLIAAAGEHFRRFGYEKTTLADLAKSIGFSKTYFYRFFSSKQEVGEAVCSQCLGRILAVIDAEIATAPSATEKLRRMLKTLPVMEVQLFFEEKKLFDIASISCEEDWSSSGAYYIQLGEKIRQILQEGRENGEFERKTPLDEVTRAILMAMDSFIDPRFLQHHLDFVPDRSNEVIGLVLRSLAP